MNAYHWDGDRYASFCALGGYFERWVMVAAVASRDAIAWGERPAVQALAGLAATFLLFWCFKHAYLVTDAADPARLWLPALPVALMALAFVGLTYEGTTRAFIILLRGATLSLGFYAAIAYHMFPTAMADQALVRGLEVFRVIAVIAAVLAWWRPSLALLPALYVLLAKDWTEHLFGIPTLTRTDYLPVVEVSMVLSLGLIARQAMQLSALRVPHVPVATSRSRWSPG